MGAPRFEICVTDETTEIRRYSISSGVFTIGRATDADIHLNIGGVADDFAQIVVSEEGTVHLQELGSDGGTVLDGAPLAGAAQWKPGQTLRVGDLVLQLSTVPREGWSELQAGDEPEASPPPTVRRGPVADPSGTLIERHLLLSNRMAQQIERGEEIARGGMGVVHEARESATRRVVAMKVMLRGKQPEHVLRFIEEAQVTAQLEHPNIVPVHELGIDSEGCVFYTMKRVQGVTLRHILQLLEHDGAAAAVRYPLSELLTIFQKVCDAVAFAHSRGVIHRDLKPANIMVGNFGEVVVMDWGLAKLLGSGAPTESQASGPSAIGSARHDEGGAFSTMEGQAMGTPPYMAPEQVRGEIEGLDARTDIFALGAILYQLLTLRLPFTGERASDVMEQIERGVRTAPASLDKTAALPHCPGGAVPVSLSAVSMKALESRPEDRYPTVRALQADVLAYQNGFATSAEGAGRTRRAALFLKRHRKVAAAGVVMLALSGAAFAAVQAQQWRERAAHQARLMAAARSAAEQGDHDTAVTDLTRAVALHETTFARETLLRALLVGARSDLSRERWGSAAIKLQQALRSDPNNAEVAQLMPLALGEGFVTIEAKFSGELLERFDNAAVELPADGTRAQPRNHGSLPVKDLRLPAGVHQFEILRDRKRWCSLPVEVSRGGRHVIAIPIVEIPAGYEYVHAGDFIQGDEGTAQADGFLGKRKRTLPGFFLRTRVTIAAEYFRFHESADYARLVNEALQTDGLTVADIQAGATSPAELQLFKQAGAAGDEVSARGLSYYEAAALARWAGARLPTEEEWEKAARGVDGRLFVNGWQPPAPVEQWMWLPVSREAAQISPYGCVGLTEEIWQWTSSRSEPNSPRFIVKGGTGNGALADRKPARRKALDPKARYHLTGVIFCRDLAPPADGAQK